MFHMNAKIQHRKKAKILFNFPWLDGWGFFCAVYGIIYLKNISTQQQQKKSNWSDDGGEAEKKVSAS